MPSPGRSFPCPNLLLDYQALWDQTHDRMRRFIVRVRSAWNRLLPSGCWNTLGTLNAPFASGWHFPDHSAVPQPLGSDRATALHSGRDDQLQGAGANESRSGVQFTRSCLIDSPANSATRMPIQLFVPICCKRFRQVRPQLPGFCAKILGSSSPNHPTVIRFGSALFADDPAEHNRLLRYLHQVYSDIRRVFIHYAASTCFPLLFFGPRPNVVRLFDLSVFHSPPRRFPSPWRR